MILIPDGAARVQNGTGEDVKKIVTVLNEAEVPSEDVVGEPSRPILISFFLKKSSDWIDLCWSLGWFVLARRRGGGQPAVCVPATGEGPAAAGLLRRRAELLGA
jgi:hypothetical protein